MNNPLRTTALLFAIGSPLLSANAARPPAPANIRAIVLPAEVLFTWDASPGADYYRLDRGGPVRRWVPLPPVTEPRLRDTDFVPLPGYYDISAFNNAGESTTAMEFIVSNATPNISLIGVTPRPVSDTAFAVAWTINGPTPFTGYGHGGGGDGMLEVGPDLDHMTLVGATSLVSERQEFVAQNLQPNTRYFYRLTSAGANNAGFTYWNTFTTRPFIAPPPVAVSLTGPTPPIEVDEDTPVDFTLTANAPDGTPLSVFVNGSQDGMVWGPPPNFTFLPNPEKDGVFIIDCGFIDGFVTINMPVFVIVRHVEDAPIAQDMSVSFTEDRGGKFFVQDSGLYFPELVNFEIVTGPTNGVLTRGYQKREFQYIPNTNFAGIDHFTFRCSYNNSTGNIAAVRLFVQPVNDPPVTPAQSVTVQAPDATRITLAGYEVDPLGDIFGFYPITYGVATPPAHGSLGSFEPSPLTLPLSIVYTPAAGFAGTDSFSYVLFDGQYSSTGVVSIVVLPPPIPAAPRGLTATAAPRKQIELNWADDSSNETSFQIEQSLFGTDNWELIATAGPNVTTYSVAGLKSNKTYSFRVRALGAAGNSDYSNVASAKVRN